MKHRLAQTARNIGTNPPTSPTKKPKTKRFVFSFVFCPPQAYCNNNNKLIYIVLYPHHQRQVQKENTQLSQSKIDSETYSCSSLCGKQDECHQYICVLQPC